MTNLFAGHAQASDYRILVRRGEQGSQADLYPFDLRDPIPVFSLPLQARDVEPLIDLNALLDDIYVEGSYDVRVNYQRPPRPPLGKDEARWASEIVAR